MKGKKMENKKFLFSDLTIENQEEIVNDNKDFFEKFFSVDILTKLYNYANDLLEKYGFEPIQLTIDFQGDVVISGYYLIDNMYKTIEKLLIVEKDNEANFKKIVKMDNIVKDISKLNLTKNDFIKYKVARQKVCVNTDVHIYFANATTKEKERGVQKVKYLTKERLVKNEAKSIEFESLYGNIGWFRIDNLYRLFVLEKIKEMKEFENYLISKNEELNSLIRNEYIVLLGIKNIKDMLLEYNEFYFDDKNRIIYD
jgi:hypothetical protein